MGPLTKLVANEVWAPVSLAPMRRAPVGGTTPWNIDQDAHGRIEICDVGRIRLARIRANPLCVEHTGTPPSAPQNANLFRVLLQLSGAAVLKQAGREVVLCAGDWALYAADRPYSLTNLERCEQRLVILPRSELWGGKLDLHALTVRRFGSRDRSSKQLVQVLDSAFEIASVHGREAAAELAAVAVHLSRLALLENAGGRVEPSELKRQRVKDYIERNLRDPTLSVASIATSLNCSKRYLHKLFADGDATTISQFILDCRLERCHAALDHLDARFGTTIAELAYSFGFKSLSHFGKAYGKRYGMTPSKARRTVCGGLNHFLPQPVPAL
jgi:AraC-like DNA-binding protein